MPQFNARQFKRARKDLNLTQRQLAYRLDICSNSICFWETERNTPSFTMLQSLSMFFASEFNAYRAHTITGVEIEDIKALVAEGTTVVPRKKIVIVTYKSGTQRWFPMNVETLQSIVNDHTNIDDLEIVEEGGEL